MERMRQLRAKISDVDSVETTMKVGAVTVAITTQPGASSSDYTTLLGTELADTFVLDSDTIEVQGLAGGDSVTAANTLVDVKVYGGDASDTVSFSGALEKGFLSLGKGNDLLTISKEFDGEAYAGKGVDTLTFTKEVTGATIKGDNGNDTITASADVISSLIQGGTDDDNITVNGTLNSSSIYGGKQQDTISVKGVTKSLVSGDKANDNITVGGILTDATIEGGAGNDSITLSAGVTASTTSTVFGGDGNDTITNSSATAVVIDGGADNDEITAQGAAKHTIFGGAGDDIIDATVGDKDVVLDGGDGDDSIVSADGKDSITGGIGKDTIRVGVGNDTIKSGAGDDSIELGGGDDFLNAGADKDNITIATGANKATIYGGKGDDSITYDAAGDLTFEDLISGDDGTDSLIFSTPDAKVDDEDFSSVSGVENFVMTGAAAGAVINTFGSKAQTAGITSVSLAKVTGNAQVIDASGYTTSITLTGNDTNLDDSLVGGSSADTFNTGKQGGLAMKGNGGNDTFNITTDHALSGGATVEDLSGSDILTIASSSGGVTATVTADFTATSASTNNLSVAGAAINASKDAKVTLTSAGNTYGYTVTGQAANVDGKGSSIVGSGKADVISGGSGNGADTIAAGGGDDSVTGKGGVDNLSGDAGNDTFIFTSDLAATDTINGGTGNDSISIDSTGNVTGVVDFDNVSNLTDIKTTASGTVGLTISPIAEGTGQTITIAAGAGVFTMTNNADSSTTKFKITGGAGADAALVGSKGADTIDGAGGADTITGGQGNDSITLGAAGDADDVVFGAAATNGIDTIVNFTSGEDDLNLIAAIVGLSPAIVGTTTDIANITGTGSINTTGEADDNVLVLNVANYQFADAAAMVAGTTTGVGSAIAAADKSALVIYGSAAATGESRVAMATVANGGGITAATDIAIIKGIGSAAANFADADFHFA
jgi:Ca2+-binding RTX toxin-like protein